MTHENNNSKNALKDLQSKLISITSVFLAELGRERAVRAITLQANFEKDLGIDSLGRVELFHRIEDAFQVQLSEELMVKAECLNDLIGALKFQHTFISHSTDFKMVSMEVTSYDPSEAQTLIEILRNRAKIEPNRHHIYLQDEKGNEKIITYGDLQNKAQKVAAGLNDYGIELGDTVAIMLPTCEEFFYAFFGIMLAGAIPVPIYPPFRPDKIEEYAMRESSILRNAEVRILITFQKAERLSELLKVFISSLKAVTTVDLLMNSKNKASEVTIEGNMPAMIQYTSGSTSLPKGVLLTHSNLLANIRAAGKAMKISPSDVAVSWLPLYHDMGLIGSWFISFYHAIPVVIMSPLTFLSRPERWLWAIHYRRATLSGAPNFAYELCIRRIKDADLQGLDLQSWRLSFNGAEAISPKTIENFSKKFAPFGFKPQTMFPVYGLAETCVALTFPQIGEIPKIDKISRESFEKEQKALPVQTSHEKYLQFVCCGKPIPGHKIRVVNVNNEIIPERTIGSLQFKGPSTMVGYYRQPEATKAITHDGWIDTGDLAYEVDGAIYITGRKKDVIIKAGRNLYPDEIEDVTSQVSGVRKGCVVAFGTEDPKSGTEKLVIVAESKTENKEVVKKLQQEVIEKISVVLGIIPDEIVIVPPKTISKTSSGKLQRSACKKAYSDKKLKSSHLPIWVQITKLIVKSVGTKIENWITVFLKSLYTCYVACLLILTGIPMWCTMMLLPSSISAFLLKYWAKIGCWLIGCPIILYGANNIPKNEAVVYVANHASYIDSVVLLAFLPTNVRFVGKKELLKVPMLRGLFKKLKYITVDRIDFSANISDTNTIIDALKEKQSIAIFPEGTFTYATGLRPFKLGAFKVAVETQTLICPIAIKGTRGIFRGNNILLAPQKVEVTIGNILRPQSKDWQEVTKLHTKSRDAIAKDCGEMVIDV